MKTFRMIGMALMAVLMSVNFTSCSNEDEDSETQPSNEKKLARVMRYEQDGGTMTIDFKYDKKGNVTCFGLKDLVAGFEICIETK